MAWKRIVLLSLILVIFGAAASWGIVFTSESKPAYVEIKTQMPDVSPAVREKAFGLLSEVLAESDALKSEHNKLEVRFFAADLLWEKDEPKARNLFREVFEGDYVCNCQDVSIITVAARDAKLAYRLREDDGIFEFYIKQYPAEAVERAKTDFDKNFNGYLGSKYSDDDGILKHLKSLYAQDASKGADFARHILTRLKNKQIKVAAGGNLANYAVTLPPYPQANGNYYNSATVNSYSGMTNKPMNLPASRLPDSPFSYPNSNYANVRMNSNYANVRINNVDFAQVREFFEAVLPAKEAAQTERVPMLTGGELGELAKLMANALVAAKRFDAYQVRGAYDGLKKYAPAEMAKLERTLTPKQLKEIKEPWTGLMLPPSLADDSSIEKLPVPPNESPEEKKEREFVDNVKYASSITNHCNIEDDAVIFARFKNKSKYPDMIEYFADQLPAATARVGNLGELRPYLEKEEDNAQKLKLLSSAADSLTAQSDKNDFLRLSNDAKIAIPQTYKNASEFKVMMNYANILSATSPAESFKYLEAQLKSINETINSAGAVAEFSEDESQENAEFRFAKMREQIARKSPLSFGMLKKLAHFDFERTVKLADRFTRPEVRLFIRWHIANSLLNKNAPDEEARFYEVEICG